ncbi:MAG: SLBB domain-containing protein [Armatimonadota bacterium]
MSVKFLIFLAVVVLVIGSGYAQAVEQNAICPGDTLRITVLGEPDYSRQAVVDNEGCISLPLASGIHVAGLSTTEAAAIVAKSLGKFLKNPDVTIETVEKARRSVTVSGQVKTPGVYTLQSGTRLMEVVGLAGGFSTTADLARVSVTRRGSTEPVICDLNQFLAGTQEAANIALEDGDVIVVPEMSPTVGVVFVYGAVKQPGQPIQIREGMRISHAISSAGGVIPEQADMLHAELKHEGQTDTVQIDLGKAMANDPSSDLPLRPGDTITVPSIKQLGMFTILGAVNSSGEFPIKENMTVAKAVATAGVSARAKMSALRLTRTNSDGKTQSMEIDLNKIADGKAQDVAVQAGDTIYVPERAEGVDKGRLITIGLTIIGILLH